jgi:hypothetical protein
MKDACFLLGLLSYPENGSSAFLQIVSIKLHNNTYQNDSTAKELTQLKYFSKERT